MTQLAALARIVHRPALLLILLIAIMSLVMLLPDPGAGMPGLSSGAPIVSA